MTNPQQPGTALATVKPGSVAALFEAPSAKELIEALLPPGVGVARLVASIRVEARRNPTLLKCVPESIVLAAARVLRRGLEIGVNAYLVPFKNNKSGKFECVDIVGYQGLAQLAMETRLVRGVEAEVVYAGDKFEYEYGGAKRLLHIPVEDPRQRGAMVGAYCIVRLPFQNWDFKYLPIADIDAVRKAHSKQWKDGPCPPWWARKRAVIVMLKLMPKTSGWQRLAAVIAEEEEIEGIEPDVQITGGVADTAEGAVSQPGASAPAEPAVSATASADAPVASGNEEDAELDERIAEEGLTL